MPQLFSPHWTQTPWAPAAESEKVRNQQPVPQGSCQNVKPGGGGLGEESPLLLPAESLDEAAPPASPSPSQPPLRQKGGVVNL